MFTDPTGMSKDDIIILLGHKRENGHITGHMAMLIGDDDSGWDYYSMDGGNSGSTVRHSIAHYDTIEDFNNSPHSAYRDNYDTGKISEAEKDKNGKVIQRYNEGYRIKTTKKQDELMNKNALKATNSNYDTTNIIGNNCTQNVRKVLDAGGLENGEYTLVSIPLLVPLIPVPAFVPNITPRTKYDEIKRSNKGEDVSHLLKL